MKTFFDLIQDVQKPGLCHRCGGCVTFCSSVNYGALELDADGKPRYGEIEKCIECGLCHAICPEIDELEKETRERVGWTAPIGRVIETTVARAADPAVRRAATDGGVVTALLLHLLERGRIDGAIVTKQDGPFRRRPFLATTTEEIKQAAGFFFDTSHGMKDFGDRYMTHSQIEEFDPMLKKGLKRVAFVGTPCQVKSVRRMQTLGLVPADAVHICLGLFCSGNFTFGEEQRRHLAEARRVRLGRRPQDQHQGRPPASPPQRRGPAASPWTISISCAATPAATAPTTRPSSRTSLSAGSAPRRAGPPWSPARRWAGRRLPMPPGRGKLEEFSRTVNPNFATQAMTKVRTWSAQKRKAAQQNRKTARRQKGVRVKAGAA